MGGHRRGWRFRSLYHGDAFAQELSAALGKLEEKIAQRYEFNYKDKQA